MLVKHWNKESIIKDTCRLFNETSFTIKLSLRKQEGDVLFLLNKETCRRLRIYRTPRVKQHATIHLQFHQVVFS